MAKTIELYNHHKQPVGTATWNKRNSTINIAYSDDIHYADTILEFEEFDHYIKRMDLRTEEMMNDLQINLFEI